MPYRDFTDSTGRAWRVWSTVPEQPRGMPADHAGGWLSFESGDTLRRLVPVPRAWEECLPERLELMCRAAEEVQRRTGPFTRLARPDPDATVGGGP